MRQLLISIFLISIPSLCIAQVETEINVIDFVKEIQQWKKKDGKMTLTWWVPYEYWRIALKDNKRVPPETLKQIESIFEGYLMIWACDLKMNVDGTMDYSSEEEIEKSITVTDQNNIKYFPLTKGEIHHEALTISESLKPFFEQALGQMGRGIHFYFFKVLDETGKSVVNAAAPGEFRVSHSNSEFQWKLPLPSLAPLRLCPIDQERMQGNWNYCPTHGQKLAE